MTKSTLVRDDQPEHFGFSDAFGRSISYLRLSVTDRCNLRCMYCHTEDPMPFIPHGDILTYEEHLRIIRLAVKMGVSKVRLTGGEPFARKNFLWFTSAILDEHPDLDLRITSNGTLLGGKVCELKEAGVRYINLSLDTFNRDKYKTITGRDMLRRVTRAIDEVIEYGIRLKINAVALRGFNDDELQVFVNFARNNPVDVRFIEFMPMGGCTRWSDTHFWSAADILADAKQYANLVPLAAGERKAGPARLFGIEGGKGRIGVISPLSNHFCNTCNRLRITPDGKLRTCLFSDKEYNLRAVLRHPRLTDRNVHLLLQNANRSKPLGYKLLQQQRDNIAVADKRMNAIGG